jgi:hypothetical protein
MATSSCRQIVYNAKKLMKDTRQQLVPGMAGELALNARLKRPNRRVTAIQLMRNCFSRKTQRDQPEDLSFTRAEPSVGRESFEDAP